MFCCISFKVLHIVCYAVRMSTTQEFKKMRSQLVADAELLRLVQGRIGSPRVRPTDWAYLDGVVERMHGMADRLDAMAEAS